MNHAPLQQSIVEDESLLLDGHLKECSTCTDNGADPWVTILLGCSDSRSNWLISPSCFLTSPLMVLMPDSNTHNLILCHSRVRTLAVFMVEGLHKRLQFVDGKSKACPMK
jgi:hypothetical protein